MVKFGIGSFYSGVMVHSKVCKLYMVPMANLLINTQLTLSHNTQTLVVI